MILALVRMEILFFQINHHFILFKRMTNVDEDIHNFSQVHLADKVYMQKNTEPTWYQLTTQSAVDPTLPGQTNPFDLTKQLLTFNSGVQFQDLGEAPGDNGGTWHRIAVTLNKAQVLKLLSSQAIAPGAIQQLVQQLLSQPASTVDGSMDINFDTKTFYVENERSQYKCNRRTKEYSRVFNWTLFHAHD